MQKLPGKYVFTIGEKRKTTRPGKHLEPIELTAFEPAGYQPLCHHTP